VTYTRLTSVHTAGRLGGGNATPQPGECGAAPAVARWFHQQVFPSRNDASPLDRLLVEQSGILTWRQAVAELTPSRVRHLLATGRWQRICRGVLATGSGPFSREAQWWVAVLAAGEEAVLAGLAAARAGGLKGSWRRQTIDVLVPYPRHAAELLRRLPFDLPAVRVRRTKHLPADDWQAGWPSRTAMARSLIDAAQWSQSDREAEALLAAGCQQRMVTPDEIIAVLDQMPQIRRRALIRQTIAESAGWCSLIPLS
jgi:hypothetical protein